MTHYTKWLFPIIALIVFILLPSLVMAQPPDGGGDPDAVPIDGGLSMLLAAGVGYGVKKIRDHRKKQREEQQNV